MTIDIFIRTYAKDLQWLEYALRSIQKYVTDYRNIVIAIPQGQGHHLAHLTAERVVEVEDMADGYIGQQLTKLEAWKYSDADVFVYWDSDVVAKEPLDIVADLFHDGKPILYKTRYASIPDCPWKGITEQAVGFPVEWEYMRRMPMVHTRSAVEATNAHLVETHEAAMFWGAPEYNKAGVRAYLASLPYRHFSEFNAIGAIAEKFHAKEYHIVDTESIDMPPPKIDQGWSWGGVTKEVIDRMKSYGL